MDKREYVRLVHAEARLMAEKKGLRAALEFYANDGDWPHPHAIEDNEIMLDRGETARAALAKVRP